MNEYGKSGSCQPYQSDAFCQHRVIQSEAHAKVHLICAIATPGGARIVAAIWLLPEFSFSKKNSHQKKVALVNVPRIGVESDFQTKMP